MLPLLLTVVTKALLYALLLLAALWCWYQVTHWKILRVASSIPSPYTAIPVFGHAHYILVGLERGIQLLLEAVGKLRNEKGWDFVTGWSGPSPVVGIFNPADVQKVLNSSCTTEKSPEYNTLRYEMRDGLLTARWKFWRITRRHINTMFHPKNLQHMVPNFNRNSRELVTVLTAHVGGAPVNVFPHVMNTSLKTVCQLIFGPSLDFDIKSSEFQGLKWVVLKMFELTSTRIVLVWLRVNLIFKLCYDKDLRKMKTLWRSFTKTPMKNAQINRKEDITDLLNYYSNSKEDTKEPLTLVDIYGFLQKNYPHITKKDLKGEMMTFYTTGSETVTTAIASCLIALAYYQEIQDKVYKEVMSVVGYDDDVTTQDILRMPYLDQVLKETLRWATVVPFIGRKTTEDISLSSHVIPTGTTIVVPIEGLNQDEKTFPNPKKFDPERFSLQNKKGREKYTYIPFSAGPRNCIGKRYAEILMKIVMVHMLRKFRISTKMDVNNAKKVFSSTLMFSEGYNISFESRCRSK